MQWMALGNLGFLFIIPAIVALYLLKRKYEDQQVSSTILWQRTLQNWEVTRPWQRLKSNLLLFLQLLAALLLVLALIRPAIPAEGAVADHTVLVIDTSGSMLTWEGDQTRFALAVEGARKIIDGLGSRQAVTLIEAGREPNVLLSKSSDKEALQKALDGLRARPGQSDLRAALSLAGAIAATEAGSGIIWFGDGGGERMVGDDAVFADSAFRFVQVGRTSENSGIGAFVTQAGEKGMDALVRIDNHDSRPKQGKATVYDMDGKLLDADSFTVEANASHSLVFHGLPSSQAYRAEISVQKDGLAEDNEMWSVPYTAEKARAVLVSPEGNRFLSQVLKMGDRLLVETMDRLPGPNDTADLWVFDRVVPDALPQGNVLVIGPERGTDWLPRTGEKELEYQPSAAESTHNHPLLKYVDWKDVHISKTAQLQSVPGMSGLVRSGEVDLVQSGTIGGRRAVIVAFDLHESDFPLRPAFPIFMQNATAWLSPIQSSPIGSAVPGEALSVPLTPGASSRTLILPDGSTQSIAAEGTTWLLQVPQQVGLYRLEEEVDGKKQTRYFTASLDAVESEIAPQSMSVSSGKQAAGEGIQPDGAATDTANAGNPGDAQQSHQPPGSREIAVWLAALALLVVFVEWRVYQRGY